MKEIKRYEVRNQIGKGSMADVFEVFDPKTDRLLAIKILREDRSEDSEYLQRFFREAKAVGSLSHPNIVSIYDIDEIDKRPFIVMEHLKGIPLSELIRSGRKFSFEEIVTIGIQLSLALDYAHSRGIIHRDIKPSNIIIISSNFKVKITDFGIAHFEDPEVTMKTRMGDVLGTPQYMSPEQIQGHIVDGRSDLFSVGVILYQLLTGERPFTGDTIPTLMYRITTMAPKPLTSLGPEVPKSMRYIVHKLLEKKPDDRYQNGKELAAALKQALTNKNKEPRKIKEIAQPAEKKPKKGIGKAVAMAASVAALAIASFFGVKQYLNLEADSGRIYGMVSSGELRNSKVGIYKLSATIAENPDINTFELVTETQTNENGVFVAPLDVPSQSLLLVAHSPNAGQNSQLTSVVHYNAGQEIGANITLFSHIASALALYSISQGETTEAAVIQANATLSDFLQIENLLVSKSVTISANSAFNPTDNARFSIINAGLNDLLKQKNQNVDNTENMFAFGNLAFDDVVFDGKLNGMGARGAIHFGAHAFSLNLLREELADSIVKIGKSFNTDFVLNDYYKIAIMVNDSTLALFEGEPSSKIKESPAGKLIAKQLDKIEAIRKKFSKRDADPTLAAADIDETSIVANEEESIPLIDEIKSKDTTPKEVVATIAEPKPQRPSKPAKSNGKSISGVVNIGGVLTGATIRVASLSGKGGQSNILVTTKTDSKGHYSATLPFSDKKTVLVAAYGGTYNELITGRKVRLKSNHLAVSAVVTIDPNSNANNINLTYFSHLAAALSNHLMKKGQPASEAQLTAYSRIKEIVGFEYQKVNPTTRFTSSEHSGLITPELAYGMYNAAIANIMLDLSHIHEIKPHTKFNSAVFANTAYEDVNYDGLLDGVSATGKIKLGKEEVTTDFYRINVAQSLVAVAQSNINQTKLKFDQYFSIASNYNESTDKIFAGAPITSMSSDGPLITKLNPGKESTLTGFVEVSAKVNDITGIKSATFWLGKTYLGDAKNPIRPSLEFNSRRFPSGIHRLKINVQNKDGKESTLTHFVYLDNKVKRSTAASNAKK